MTLLENVNTRSLWLLDILGIEVKSFQNFIEIWLCVCDDWWPDELIPASGNRQTSPKRLENGWWEDSRHLPIWKWFLSFWLLCFLCSSGQQDEDWSSCQGKKRGKRLMQEWDYEVWAEGSKERSLAGGTWALFLLKRPAAVRKKPFSDLPLWSWWTAVPPGGVASNRLCTGCVLFLARQQTAAIQLSSLMCCSPPLSLARCALYADGPQEESLRTVRANEVQEQLHRTLNSPDVDFPLWAEPLPSEMRAAVSADSRNLTTWWLEVQLLVQRRQNIAWWESSVDDSGVRVMFSQLYKPLRVTRADCELPAGGFRHIHLGEDRQIEPRPTNVAE